MGSFKVIIAQSAEVEFRGDAFGVCIRRQINQRIMRLKEERRPPDGERLSEEEKYRLRIHGWIVLYEVDDARKIVTVWVVRKD